MKPDWNVLERSELERAARLIGIDEGKLESLPRQELISRIEININPNLKDWNQLYQDACEHLDAEWSKGNSGEKLKESLYEAVRSKIEEAIKNMDENDKKTLKHQIEENTDDETLDKLQSSKVFTRRSVAAGGAVLGLQGGAVALTGSNLGIFMLMSSGLGGLSGLLGVSFPFAIYTGVATAGGWVMTAAGILASGPAIALSLTAVAGYYGWSFFKKNMSAHLVKLSNVNYLIQSKKKLEMK